MPHGRQKVARQLFLQRRHVAAAAAAAERTAAARAAVVCAAAVSAAAAARRWAWGRRGARAVARRERSRCASARRRQRGDCPSSRCRCRSTRAASVGYTARLPRLLTSAFSSSARSWREMWRRWRGRWQRWQCVWRRRQQQQHRRLPPPPLPPLPPLAPQPRRPSCGAAAVANWRRRRSCTRRATPPTRSAWRSARQRAGAAGASAPQLHLPRLRLVRPQLLWLL